MTIAEYIADQLFKIGVKYVFGVPGGPSIPYMEAFRSAGIDFMLTSNEAAAGIMADVYARLTGVPGVCHSTMGPGATNMTTGAGSSLLDRSPVLILTSEMDDRMINRTVQMNIDHQKLFEPVTKASFRLNPDNAAEVIYKAIQICQEEYPGPVHIGIPSDIANSEVRILPGSTTDTKSQETINDRETVISLLKRARKPIVAAGLTASRLSVGHMLVSFLEHYAVPVVLTPMAKGLLDEDHPCYAGVLFHALSDCLEGLFEDVDLVIGVGYDPVEYNYESWMPDVPLIHFNTKITDMPPRDNIIQYCSKPIDWFRILENLDQRSLVNEMDALQLLRNEYEDIFKGFRINFGIVSALKIIQEEMPIDTLVTFDVGSHLHVAGQLWRTYGKRNLLITNGWSGMGFALPAALAARITNPERNIVCVTGDGGFLMMAGEIITARRYNLPVVIVVLSDGELNLIKLKQKWHDYQPYGTNLYSGDLFDSDIFLGIEVISAETEESMRQAVKDSLLLNKPVIINARIDSEEYNWLVVKR